jgi:uncharacterized protein (TIGR03435 family)
MASQLIKLDLRTKLLSLALASTALATPAAIAQSSTTPQAKPILFETISIRPVKSDRVNGDNFTADGYSMRGITAWSLITFYEEHPSDRTDGVPDWAQHEQYDIKAKVADADVAAWGKLDFNHKKLAMYALLEDRFKVKVHREKRDFPGYALLIAKGGSKLKEATPGDLYPKGYKAAMRDGPFLGAEMTGRGVATGQAASMADIANILQAFAPGPVVDKTGLTGKYDFTLKCAPPAPASSESEVSDPAECSIFTALQEQLGLKLEKSTVHIDYIVVDHIERPTEN